MPDQTVQGSFPPDEGLPGQSEASLPDSNLPTTIEMLNF